MYITRAALIKLAFEAIKQHNEEVSVFDQHHLLYAACTMPRVAAGAWIIDGDCGCLVGTMLINDAAGDEDKAARRLARLQNMDYIVGGEPLLALGKTFDDLLKNELGGGPFWGPIQVID